jgi:hypothetical protein
MEEKLKFSSIPYLPPLRDRIFRGAIIFPTFAIGFSLIRLYIKKAELDGEWTNLSQSILQTCLQFGNLSKEFSQRPEELLSKIFYRTIEATLQTSVRSLQVAIEICLQLTQTVILMLSNSYTRTWRCLMQVIYGSTAHILIDVVKTVTETWNIAMGTLQTQFSQYLNEVNLGVINAIQSNINIPGIISGNDFNSPDISSAFSWLGVALPPISFPDANLNPNMLLIPSSVSNDLENAIAQLPTPNEIWGTLQDAIKIPFEELSKLLQVRFNEITRSISLSPPEGTQENITMSFSPWSSLDSICDLNKASDVYGKSPFFVAQEKLNLIMSFIMFWVGISLVCFVLCSILFQVCLHLYSTRSSCKMLRNFVRFPIETAWRTAEPLNYWVVWSILHMWAILWPWKARASKIPDSYGLFLSNSPTIRLGAPFSSSAVNPSTRHRPDSIPEEMAFSTKGITEKPGEAPWNKSVKKFGDFSGPSVKYVSRIAHFMFYPPALAIGFSGAITYIIAYLQIWLLDNSEILLLSSTIQKELLDRLGKVSTCLILQLKAHSRSFMEFQGQQLETALTTLKSEINSKIETEFLSSIQQIDIAMEAISSYFNEIIFTVLKPLPGVQSSLEELTTCIMSSRLVLLDAMKGLLRGVLQIDDKLNPASLYNVSDPIVSIIVNSGPKVIEVTHDKVLEKMLGNHFESTTENAMLTILAKYRSSLDFDLWVASWMLFIAFVPLLMGLVLIALEIGLSCLWNRLVLLILEWGDRKKFYEVQWRLSRTTSVLRPYLRWQRRSWRHIFNVTYFSQRFFEEVTHRMSLLLILVVLLPLTLVVLLADVNFRMLWVIKSSWGLPQDSHVASAKGKSPQDG